MLLHGKGVDFADSTTILVLLYCFNLVGPSVNHILISFLASKVRKGRLKCTKGRGPRREPAVLIINCTVFHHDAFFDVNTHSTYSRDHHDLLEGVI
jgi:hypothetical protein